MNVFKNYILNAITIFKAGHKIIMKSPTHNTFVTEIKFPYSTLSGKLEQQKREASKQDLS